MIEPQLIIPQVVRDNEARERERIWKEKREARFRDVIRRGLTFINDELRSFEQTTHAHLVMGSKISAVTVDLKEAWEDPRAFTISNLSQSIERFLKESES